MCEYCTDAVSWEVWLQPNSSSKMIQFDRFNKDRLLEAFMETEIDFDAKTVNISYFMNSNQESDTSALQIEIILDAIPKEGKSEWEYYTLLVRDILLELPEFDNIVQKSLKGEFLDAEKHVNHFLYDIYRINASSDLVILNYKGRIENDEISYSFEKNGDKWEHRGKNKGSLLL